MPTVLTSSQTIYLANLDGTTNRVTSHSSERIDYYCDYEEAVTQKCLRIAYIYLNRVIIVLPDTDVAVIFLYQSVTNLTFLDAYGQNWYR